LLISSVNDETKRWGLMQGDVVVAVRGYRVRDFRSCKVPGDLSENPPLGLVIWRAGACSAMSASPPGNHFGIDFADYDGRWRHRHRLICAGSVFQGRHVIHAGLVAALADG
jgi:hypothetical protein